MKPTIKQLQTTIKAKDALLEDSILWVKLLSKAVKLSTEREDKLRARIRVLGKALMESERDYEKLMKNLKGRKND